MKLNFFQKILFFLNCIVAICLLLAYLAPFVSPQKFWLLSFFGISYPVFVILSLAFFFFWLLQKKWVALFSLLVIAGGYNFLNRFYAFHPSTSDDSKNNKSIKLLSYNVKNFNYYQWTRNKEERKKFIDFLKAENPDIICFQEFYTSDKGFFQNISAVQKELNLPYYAFEEFLKLRKTERWGWAVFSKYPVISSEKIKFSNSRWNGAITVNLKIGKDTVSIFNLHLQSLHFHKQDYEYIDQLAEEQDAELAASKKIFTKLKIAFKKRAVQAGLIADKIKNSPYPVVVCGDFNDTPASFAYEAVRGDLQDAFLEKGFGVGQTYTGYFAPFRIDYVFIDKKLKVQSFKTIRKSLSDHYPVICEFSF